MRAHAPPRARQPRSAASCRPRPAAETARTGRAIYPCGERSAGRRRPGPRRRAGILVRNARQTMRDARSSADAETGNHLWSRHLRQYRPKTQLTAAPNVFAMLAIPIRNQMSKPSAATRAERTASEDNGRIVAAANALTKSDTYAAASN